MASTGLKIALGVVIGVSVMGAIGSRVTPNAQAAPPSSPPTAPATAATTTTTPPVVAPSNATAKHKHHEDTSRSTSEATVPDSGRIGEAERTVAYIIRLNHQPCVKPIDVAPTAAPNIYGVTCTTHHFGVGRANYLINTETNDVARI